MSKKPFEAPAPAYGERDYRFLQRLAKEFEDWVNAPEAPELRSIHPLKGANSTGYYEE